MGKAVIEISGIDTFLKHINSVATQEKLRQGVSLATANVEAAAKHLCPVDTGNLRNSIHSSVKVNERTVVGRISTSVEYAAYVEFGTGIRGENSDYPKAQKLGLAYRQDWKGQKAQPFMYPALKQNENFVKAVIANAIEGE